MTALTFIAIIAVLIFIHELGHFLAAKFFGVRVESFAIGFPPTIAKFVKGETTYKLNLIPFGGYVKIFGESPDDETQALASSPRNMQNKPYWQRLVILFAGILFNLILAWGLLAGSYASDVPRTVSALPEGVPISEQSSMVVEVLPGSSAAQAGILPGDQLLPDPVLFVDALEFQTLAARVDAADLQIQRGDENFTISLEPALIKGYEGKRLFGVMTADVGIAKLTLGQAIGQGFKDTVHMTKNVVLAFVNLIADAFRGRAALETLTGPVGLVSVVDEASNLGFAFVLHLAALISVNLAVLNAMPFPALDGGRMMLLIIEKIRKKSLSPKLTNAINAVGFLLLILLMILVTVSDISKLL